MFYFDVFGHNSNLSELVSVVYPMLTFSSRNVTVESGFCVNADLLVVENMYKDNFRVNASFMIHSGVV